MGADASPHSTARSSSSAARAGAGAGAGVDRDVLLELLSHDDEFRVAAEAGGFLRIEDEIFAL